MMLIDDQHDQQLIIASRVEMQSDNDVISRSAISPNLEVPKFLLYVAYV